MIRYLLDRAKNNDWAVAIGEKDIAIAKKKIPKTKTVPFDVLDKGTAIRHISEADLVVSMLPAGLHLHVAKICARIGKDLLTASYLTEEVKALDGQFRANGNQCIMELGLGPGIDHMLAMKALDRIRHEGHEPVAFETFTGGVLANNKQKDNPWGYKFTWNPRNVVLAGGGNVKFLQESKLKYIPYHKLFKRTRLVHIPGHGDFEGYANRDSLKYLDLYGLRGIKTLYRGTLRRAGFCKAWDILIQIGATADGHELEGARAMTHRQFVDSFLPYNPREKVEQKLARYMNIGLRSEEMHKLQWSGIFADEPIGLEKGTPAEILEHILKKKWTMEEGDKDLVVVWHKINYLDCGKPKEMQSSMVATGDGPVHTAMAKAVGLPLGIAARLILDGKLRTKGVSIPTKKEIYVPILEELENMGFEFSERETGDVSSR